MIDVANNVSQVLQAIGRVHRLGAKMVQEIFILVVADSYDAAIEGRQSRKMIQQLAGEGYIEETSDRGIQAAAAKLLQKLLGQDTSRLEWTAINRGRIDRPSSTSASPEIASMSPEPASVSSNRLDPGNTNVLLQLEDLPLLHIQGLEATADRDSSPTKTPDRTRVVLSPPTISPLTPPLKRASSSTNPLSEPKEHGDRW